METILNFDASNGATIGLEYTPGDGRIEVYVDTGEVFDSNRYHSMYDERCSDQTVRIPSEEVPDFLVAVQTWIEQLEL